MGVFEEMLAELQQLRQEFKEHKAIMNHLLQKVEGTPDEEYLDIQESANLLNVEPSWFYNKKNKTKVNATKVAGKLMCRKSELVNYINTRV